MHYFPSITKNNLIQISPLLSRTNFTNLQSSFITDIPRLTSVLDFKQTVISRPTTAKPAFSRDVWAPYDGSKNEDDVFEENPRINRPKLDRHKTSKTVRVSSVNNSIAVQNFTSKTQITKNATPKTRIATNTSITSPKTPDPPKPVPWYAEKSKSFHKDLEKNFKTVRISKKVSRDSSEDQNSEIQWYENRTQPIYQALRSERPSTSSSIPRKKLISKSLDDQNLIKPRRNKPLSGLNFEDWLENTKLRNRKSVDYQKSKTSETSQEERDQVYKLWLKKKRTEKKNTTLNSTNPSDLSISTEPLAKRSEEQISSAIKIWLKTKNRESRQIRRQERVLNPSEENLRKELEKQKHVEIRAYEKWLSSKNKSEVKSQKAELKQVKSERKESEKQKRFEEVGGEIIASLRRQKEESEYNKYLAKRKLVKNRMNRTRKPENVALPVSVAESIDYGEGFKIGIFRATNTL